MAESRANGWAVDGGGSAWSTSDSMSVDRRQQLFVNFVIGLKGTRVQAKMLSTRNIILEQIRDIGHSMNSATCKANLDSTIANGLDRLFAIYILFF